MPECDVGENNRQILFNQTWVHYAIPTLNDTLEKCERNAPANTIEIDGISTGIQCSAEHFNRSSKIKCDEYIYASDEKNLQTEVKLT